jgi:HPt (histidine-containing phosphotransfer) domain-containing protein
MVMKSINSLGEFMNLPELLERVENDQELLAELFALFREDLPASRAALQAAVHGDDLREIERTAHRLKGMLANLSAKQAASLAAEIESTAGAGNATKIRELMSTFDLQVSSLSAALDSLMTSA